MKTASFLTIDPLRHLLPATGLAALLLVGPSLCPAAVFDYSPQLKEILVSRNGVDLNYRVYDPYKEKFVGESDIAPLSAFFGTKDGVLCFEGNGVLSCRVYDSHKRKWVGAEVDSGAIDTLVGADGIVSWISGREVHVVVYDCARSKWVAERMLMDAIPTNLMIRDGLVTWQDGAAVHYAVYDPVARKWKAGDKFSEGAVKQLRVVDGVLSWHNGRTVFMRIYDPKLGEWRGQKVTTGEVDQFGSDGGMVAWTAFQKVHSHLYDPSREKWTSDEESSDGEVSGLMVSDGTVRWISGVDGESEGIRGYHPGEGKWRSHATPPFASFVVTPKYGEAPLKVHFVDMSFGANGWCWEFGDGGGSTHRSPGHTYMNEGAWIARLTVSGLGDQVDMRTKTVPVGLIEPEVGEVIAEIESLEFGPAEAMEVVDGVFQATIVGKAGQVVIVETSSDMKEWQPAATLRNRTGSVQFYDSAAGEGAKRYYRVKSLAP